MSHTLFNVFVDAVVWKWLAVVMEDMVIASTGLRSDDPGCLSPSFYADDGEIGSLDHEWLLNANQHLYNLFRDCTNLKPNTEKTEARSYHPGAILGRCSMKGYNKGRHEGTGETYNKRKGK